MIAKSLFKINGPLVLRTWNCILACLYLSHFLCLVSICYFFLFAVGDVQDIQANQIPVVTHQTFPMKFEIDVLQPAEHYLFHIRAKSSNFSLRMSTSRNGGVIGTSKNEWFTLPFSTSPAKLEAPTMESKNEDSITVNWEPYQKIAEGAEFLYYQIKATRKNNRGDIVRCYCLYISLSRAVSNFYGTYIEIWAGFGLDYEQLLWAVFSCFHRKKTFYFF